jgi:hypoxanthine phosphoribosyltransferase
MTSDIDEILIPRQRISDRVAKLAEQITIDFRLGRGEEEITIVPILSGAMIFCCDLIRHIPLAIKIGLLTVSSYPGRSIRAQGAQILSQQVGDIRGRHVLLVDDILDSGGTLAASVPVLTDLGAAQIRTCVLLRKDRPAARMLDVDYVGFEIPDVFVVGYGLDYNDYYRNLPDIVTLKDDVIGKSP